MTQKQRVMRYLVEYHFITPLDAWRDLGVYRLAARIGELRKDGYNITTGKSKVLNRFNEEVTVAQYRLEDS